MPLLPCPDFSYWRIALHSIDLFVIDSAKPVGMIAWLSMSRVVSRVRGISRTEQINPLELVPIAIFRWCQWIPESKLRVSL